MDKTVVIIQARMGSTRLPGKVLKEVYGKELLVHQLDRLELCQEVNEIVVATTVLAEDDQIEKIVLNHKHRVVRGDEEDVLSRHHLAAESVGADVIVRITSDCPLIDPKIVDEAIKHFKISNLDFYSNSEPIPSSWPDGMDVSIFRKSALDKANALAFKPSDREHVTFYFWQNPSLFKCEKWELSRDLSPYRLTIDYQEDLTVMESVITHFSKTETQEMWPNTSMNSIIDYLDNYPEIFEINQKYYRGMGWESSFEKDRSKGY